MLKVLSNEVLDLHRALGSFADVKDPSAEISTRLDRIRRSKEEVEIAQRALNAARIAYDETRQEVEACSARRTEIAAVLIRVCDRAGIDSPGIGDAATQLIEAAESARRALADAIERAESTRKEGRALVTEDGGCAAQAPGGSGHPAFPRSLARLPSSRHSLALKRMRAPRLKADLNRKATLIEESAVVRRATCDLEQLHRPGRASIRLVPLTGERGCWRAGFRAPIRDDQRPLPLHDGRRVQIIDAFRADTVRAARHCPEGRRFSPHWRSPLDWPMQSAETAGGCSVFSSTRALAPSTPSRSSGHWTGSSTSSPTIG